MSASLPFTIPGLPVASSIQAGNLNLNNLNPAGAGDRYLQSLVNRSILVPIGVGSVETFVFDYKGDESVDMHSDISDHYLEDNTAVQDHIGVKPISVTLRGYVSELSLSTSVANSISAALAAVENQLSQADAYLGHYTPGATQAMFAAITQAQKIAIQIEQATARAAQIASFFLPGPQYNKQQTAYNQLNALWKSQYLCTVVTPFEVFSNMAIVSVKALQSANSRTISDFTVSLKQVRFTESLLQSRYLEQFGGNASSNWQSPNSGGTTAGLTAPISDVTSKFTAAA